MARSDGVGVHTISNPVRSVTWRRVEARVMGAGSPPPVRQLIGGSVILFLDGPPVYVANTDRGAFGQRLESRELVTAEVVSSWLAWVHQRAAVTKKRRK